MVRIHAGEPKPYKSTIYKPYTVGFTVACKVFGGKVRIGPVENLEIGFPNVRCYTDRSMEYIILVAICLGVIPGFIAQSKGRSFVGWWLYGAALFIVALPHSLIISKDTQKIEREQIAAGTSKKCPFCAEIIKAEARVCRFCGRDLPTVEKPVAEVMVKEPERPISEDELDRRFKEWHKKGR